MVTEKKKRLVWQDYEEDKKKYEPILDKIFKEANAGDLKIITNPEENKGVF